ncbi:DUF3224 domain-containing protein [Microlunatus sp. Gsoil 973]|uniref:DUF3224 domain-containing protein n=1 Tax=Microlunatus sp. Gsoil 973 TaxID=2672569 RepID=UPI0012B4826B|nr:DUF3224 domain-containing protein [Microlunatus sp. Gsoil 973]QGN32524.1 DUF3224 family protein [Microlunatus sp. Gsoil 973]
MTFTWSNLIERATSVVDGRYTTTDWSTVDVLSFDRHIIADADASGITLVRDTLTERFTGGIDGDGRAEHIRHLRPDGSNTFVGIERVTAVIDGRLGSFSLTCHGTTATDGVVHGFWRVIPGSGANGLATLHGVGEFIARQQPDGHFQAKDCFTHWYGQDDDAANCSVEFTID